MNNISFHNNSLNIVNIRTLILCSFMLFFCFSMISGCTGNQAALLAGAKDITLDFNSDIETISIPRNETIKIKFKLNELTAKIADILSYDVDKKDVASVAKTGGNTFEIKGLMVGEANLKLSIADKSKTFKIEVMDKPASPEPTPKTIIIYQTVSPIPTPTPTATPTEILSPSPTCDYEFITQSSVSICSNQDKELRVRIIDCTGKDVNKDVNYELTQSGVVSVIRTGNVFTLKANSSGNTTLKLSIGNAVKNVSIDVSSCDPPPPPPPEQKVPTNLSASNITRTSFTLSWTGVTGATGYRVYLSDYLHPTTFTTTSANIGGLDPGTTYNIEVSAVTGAVESARSSILNVAIPLIPPPPTNLGFNTVTYNSFNLTWTAAPGATGYKVYKDGVFYSDAAGTSLAVTGLNPLSIYNMAVSSVSASGESGKCTKVPVTTTYYYLDQWGSYGSDPGKFNGPRGIATDTSGYVYVVEYYRIQKLDKDGTFQTQWGSWGAGNGQFKSPWGIATDTSDNLYVADTDNYRIQKFDKDGTYLTQWGSWGAGNGQFKNPQAVATDTSGNVYVTDSGNDRIQKFNSSGTYITQWGSNGAGNGQFNGPFGIATDTSGNVYVVETGNKRIQKFDSTGTYITKWGSNGTGDGQFGAPFGIATDTSGNVYVVDYGNARIQKFDSSGNFIAKWGSYGRAPEQLSNPYGIGIDTSGNLYVDESGLMPEFARVQKFKL